MRDKLCSVHEQNNIIATMANFQELRDKKEQKAMMRLLSAIEDDSSFTQRKLSRDLGIALGLINQYLKSSVAKGWVRASQVSPRRIAYFLTPAGFKEKSRMVRTYLATSLSFFRDARLQCGAAFQESLQKGWTKILLVGEGDLADIATLVAQGTPLHLKITNKTDNLGTYDAVLITDIIDPQGTYNILRKKVEPSRLLVLDLLHISKKV